MNNTSTTKLVKHKYNEYVKRQVVSWRNSFNKYLTTRENYIKWAYETQERSFNQIADDIRAVASCKDDDITAEAVRLIYHKLQEKEGGAN